VSGAWDAGEDRVDEKKRRRIDRQGRIIARLLRLWGGSWRLHEDHEALAKARRSSPSGAVIYVCWHNRMIMLSYTHRDRGAQVLRSGSRDGQLIAAVNRRLGFDMPAGSSSRGGSSGLRKLLRSARQGRDTALTVDGPRGPRGHLQAGALQLALLSGCPILPVAVSASRRKVFGSWDRTLLPWPFARLELRYGEPFFVKEGEDLSLRRQVLEDRLRDLTDALDEEMGHAAIPPGTKP
jgi:lysophospholipid acyltransferase (LPLAT)-like uncharacterized protein